MPKMTDSVISAEDAELVALNVEKARAVAGWLDSLGVAQKAALRSGLSADLSDIYAAATQYQRLLDALLAVGPDQREGAADALIDVGMELDHIAWHIRSCRKRITRLARTLYPEDDED